MIIYGIKNIPFDFEWIGKVYSLFLCSRKKHYIRFQSHSLGIRYITRVPLLELCMSHPNLFFWIVRGHHTLRHYQNLSSFTFSWTGLVPYVSGETTFRRESKSPSVSQVFIYNPPLIGKVGILYHYHYQSERKQIIISSCWLSYNYVHRSLMKMYFCWLCI